MAEWIFFTFAGKIPLNGNGGVVREGGFYICQRQYSLQDAVKGSCNSSDRTGLSDFICFSLGLYFFISFGADYFFFFQLFNL